jgi:predicted nucleic acid-binding protein
LFANRYTAFVDACVLAGNLRRDLLLTLAEAEFFRIRWSSAVLNEMQSAVEQILGKDEDTAKRAGRVRALMEASFSDARVDDFDSLLTTACGALPDKDDAHVVAAALKTRADVIVTDNLKDFPEKVLAQLGLDVRSADAFIADTIMLDTGRAVDAMGHALKIQKTVTHCRSSPSQDGSPFTCRHGGRSQAFLGSL